MNTHDLLPRRPLHVAIDCAAILAMLTAATLAFEPVFGGSSYLGAGLGGAIGGIAVGVITSMRPLRGWLQSAAGLVLAFLLLGPALAVRHGTIAGVIPTLDGLRELVLGVVFSWKGLLTAEPPAEGFPSLLVVPFLTTLVCGTVATVLAIRLRRGAPWAMLPPFVALVVGILFGTKIASFPILLGLVCAGVAVTWIAWRTASWRRSLAEEVEVTSDARFAGAARKRALVGGIAMVGAALLVGGVASVPITPTDRSVLRDTVEPPIDLEQFPSPLAGFRYWYKHFEDETLLTVSGMPEDARLRIATFDAFDGTVFAVAGTEESTGSGSFSRVGDRISVQQSGTPASVAVDVGAYSGIWVPDVGYAQRIVFSGDRASDLQGSLHYNGQTGTAIALDGLAAGDAYTLDAIVPRQPAYDELEGVAITDVQLPKPRDVPDLLAAWVAENAKGSTRLETIQHMVSVMNAGIFSHGIDDDESVSLAGHGSARLQQMLRDPVLVGDDEQYATLFALALARLEIPSRVVMGFYPDDGFDGSADAVELTGGDLHAWVEVPFEGFGWVAFDPTPPEDNTQIQESPQPQPVPKPQVLQPPQPPDEPVELTPDTQPDDGQDDQEPPAESIWLTILAIVGTILLILLLLAAPFLIVAWLKARRRRRRFEAASQSDRLAGGWHEFTDHAVDLGLVVPAGVTRREVAGVVADRYPQSRATAIGDFVDAGVFGPGEPDAQDVDAFWDDVDRSVKAMQHEASKRERLLSMLSLRSFLRRKGWR